MKNMSEKKILFLYSIFTCKIKSISFLFLFFSINFLYSSKAYCQSPKPVSKLINISTNNTSLILRVDEKNKLKVDYYGKKLLDITEVSRAKHLEMEAYPAFGMGSTIDPALNVVHGDGNISADLVYTGNATYKQTENLTVTTIKLRDARYPFYIELQYKAYQEEDIIESLVSIRHEEKKPVILYNYASAHIPLKGSSYWLTHFHGGGLNEMTMSETMLTSGSKVIESKDGIKTTSGQNPSFILSLDNKVQEYAGEVIAGTLAWSGNFRLGFEIDKSDRLHITAGINPFSAAYTLPKNEIFQTPAFIFTYSNQGKSRVSINFHKWARKYGLQDGSKVREVVLNSWEGAYFDFNEEKLKGMMDGAAQLGVEMFVLDDGWFGNKYPRNNDLAGLGDWQVNKNKLPHGINYLAEEAAKRNLKFGIWVEPEMVNPESELYKTHLDWTLQQKYRIPALARNQLVLDLSNPKVQDFVFSTLDNTLKLSKKIAYVKWDCNRYILNYGSTYLPPNKQTHLSEQYTRGFYKVLNKIKQKYPEVTFQLCAGGGGRVEYGALPYFHEFWPSDNTDALQRIFIQWGTSHFFPSIAMASHVTVVPNHQTFRSTPLKFRFDVAMMGRLGIELDPNKMTPEEVRFAKDGIDTYKSIRDVVQKGDLYRLVSPYDGNMASLMYVSENKNRAVLFAYLLKLVPKEEFSFIKLKGLHPEKRYLIKEININREISKPENKNHVFSGDFLMNYGIKPDFFKREFDSVVFELIEMM